MQKSWKSRSGTTRALPTMKRKPYSGRKDVSFWKIWYMTTAATQYWLLAQSDADLLEPRECLQPFLRSVEKFLKCKRDIHINSRPPWQYWQISKRNDSPDTQLWVASQLSSHPKPVTYKLFSCKNIFCYVFCVQTKFRLAELEHALTVWIMNDF